MSLLQNSSISSAAWALFDYQSECHCSKTVSWPRRPRGPFDYQSECHCSKTEHPVIDYGSQFDYQSECHCSKTGDTACPHCVNSGNSKPVKPSKVAKEYHQYCKCHIALVFGKAAKVADGESVGKAFYVKPRKELELVERMGIDMLTFHGINPIVLWENPLARANIDLLIDGELWEMKNVTNGKSSLKSQLKRAKKKWEKLELDEPIRVVFTTYGRTDDFEKIVKAARRKTGFDEALVVSEDKIVVIKNR